MKKHAKKLKPRIKAILRNKTILVTGGAGSIASHFVKRILDYPVKTIRVLDIDEHALFVLGRSVNDKRVRLLLGSILDKDRLDMAGKNVDIIIHTAAIKNIEISEYNPIETIDTNINGTVNLIKMVFLNKPKIFLNISTDKATEPTTLYGETKQLSERLTSWAGTHTRSTKFSSIRFGNIFETRGNVFEIWENEVKNKQPLSLTDPFMKRFYYHVDEAVDFILDCLPVMKSGEIFVPKMKLYDIKKLAKKFSKNYKIIGIREGEKLEEILLTKSEKRNAVEKTNMWIIRQYK